MSKLNLEVDGRDLTVYYKTYLPRPASGSRCFYCRKRDPANFVTWAVEIESVVDNTPREGEISLTSEFGRRVAVFARSRLLNGRHVCGACHNEHSARVPVVVE